VHDPVHVIYFSTYFKRFLRALTSLDNDKLLYDSVHASYVVLTLFDPAVQKVSKNVGFFKVLPFIVYDFFALLTNFVLVTLLRLQLQLALEQNPTPLFLLYV